MCSSDLMNLAIRGIEADLGKFAADTFFDDQHPTLKAGKQIERMVIQTDWENDEAIAFLQHRFKRLGLDEALEKAGARDGDEIRILGYDFEFESARMHEDVYRGLDL